jgi:hypothetical protein
MPAHLKYGVICSSHRRFNWRCHECRVIRKRKQNKASRARIRERLQQARKTHNAVETAGVPVMPFQVVCTDCGTSFNAVPANDGPPYGVQIPEHTIYFTSIRDCAVCRVASNRARRAVAGDVGWPGWARYGGVVT